MNKLLKLLFRRLNTINIIFQANNCTIKYLQRMPQTVRKINHFGDNKKTNKKKSKKKNIITAQLVLGLFIKICNYS